MKTRTYTDMKERLLEYRRRKLKMCVEYKGGICATCKTPYVRDMFDFHHLDRRTKSFGIAGNLTRKWEDLERELDKCELLCVECHRKTYATRFQS